MANRYDYLTGETVHISANDLTLRDGTPVTAGATVVIAIEDRDGTVESTETVTVATDGDDWGADLTIPSTAGHYYITVAASYSGAVWKAREPITARPE